MPPRRAGARARPAPSQGSPSAATSAAVGAAAVPPAAAAPWRRYWDRHPVSCRACMWVVLPTTAAALAGVGITAAQLCSDPESVIGAYGNDYHLHPAVSWVARKPSRPKLCPGARPPRHEDACEDSAIGAKVGLLDRHTAFLFNILKASYNPACAGDGLVGTVLRIRELWGKHCHFNAFNPHDVAQTTHAASVMRIPTVEHDRGGIHKTSVGLEYTLATGKTWEMHVPTEDHEDYEGSTGGLQDQIFYALFELLAHPVRNPVGDLPMRWDDAEQGTRAVGAAAGGDMRMLSLHAGVSDQASDPLRSISWWAFSGIAAHRLECPGVTGDESDTSGRQSDLRSRRRKVRQPVPADEHCQVDMTLWGELDVRPGFERYGAKAFFSADRELTKIFWSHGNRTVRPGEKDWEHAKWAWKVSVIVGVTIRDHLFGVHLAYANTLTVASREMLPPDHPLRRLVKPFTFRTISINAGARSTLIGNNSLVHRAVAYPFGEIQRGFRIIMESSRWILEPAEVLRLKGTDTLGDDYPFGQDWVAYAGVMRDFVDAYVAIYYGRGEAADEKILNDPDVMEFWEGLHMLPEADVPSLKDCWKTVCDGRRPRETVVSVLSMFFTMVTGMHNQVGNVADYLVDPAISATKIRAGEEVADVQSAFQALNIALTTAMPMPMVTSNVDHLLLDSEARQVWAKFHADLAALGASIEQRNKRRGFYTINTWKPEKILHSVSV